MAGLGDVDPAIESPAELTERRRLVWDNCLNVRDLGNLPSRGGRRTVSGRLVRADALNLLAESGRQALVDYGIRTIIDLRLPDESRAYSYAFAKPGPHGISYHQISFIDPVRFGESAPAASLADDYRGMLERFGQRVVQVHKTIANAPDGGVVFHCAAGKDRTGLIAALLLDLVGVSPDIIAADYAISGEWRQPATEEWLASGPGTRAEREAAVSFYWPHPEVMLSVLAYLRREYAGAEGYLSHNGLTDAEMRRLTERIL